MRYTSYERAGTGDPLVLLHPGGVDARVFASLVPGLADAFEVFSPDRRGHGRTPDVPGPISDDLMARDTVRVPGAGRRRTRCAGRARHGPALVMVGDDEDRIPLDHPLALRSGLPDAQLAVLPAAGHGLPLDRPELFTLLVTEFLTMAG